MSDLQLSMLDSTNALDAIQFVECEVVGNDETRDENDKQGVTTILNDCLNAFVEKVRAPQESAPSISIDELFNQYYESHLKSRSRQPEWSRGNYNRCFTDLAQVPANKLSPLDVKKWHSTLALTRGEATANRALTVLRTIYNFGDKFDILDCKNPARAVKKFTEEPRDRFVADYERPRLIEALEKHSTFWTKDIFLMCLYSAQRLQNVCSMRWDDIDFDGKVWRIPRSSFKTGKTHVVPLVEEACVLLNARRNNSSEYVFPSRYRHTKTHAAHTAYPYVGWRKVLKAAGISDLTPHDLRRTHATMQASLGENLVTIGGTLGHKGFQSTSVYARAQTETLRFAMQRAVYAMGLGNAKAADCPLDDVAGPSARVETDTAIAIAELSELAKTANTHKPQAKNADVRLNKADQLIVEGKILSTIRSGGTSKKNFYQKIGACFRVNSRELERVLVSMETRGLIERCQAETGRWDYAICDN